MKKRFILLAIGLMCYVNGCAFVGLTNTSLTNDKSKEQTYTFKDNTTLNVG